MTRRCTALARGFHNRNNQFRPLVIYFPHLGHFSSKQGTPLSCGMVWPHSGHTQSPPGPSARPPPIPRPPPPRPCPVPPCPVPPCPPPDPFPCAGISSSSAPSGPGRTFPVNPRQAQTTARVLQRSARLHPGSAAVNGIREFPESREYRSCFEGSPPTHPRRHRDSPAWRSPGRNSGRLHPA